jgi:hypothetical protein
LDYIRLDAGSEWSTHMLPVVLLRQGDLTAAREAARKMKNDHTWFGGVLQACLRPGAALDIGKLKSQVRAARPAMLGQRDPEFR